MDVLLKPDGQIYLGRNRSGPVSADEMMDQLRKRMSVLKLRTVTVMTHSSVSDEILQELISRLRTEKIELKITIQ